MVVPWADWNWQMSKIWLLCCLAHLRTTPWKIIPNYFSLKYSRGVVIFVTSMWISEEYLPTFPGFPAGCPSSELSSTLSHAVLRGQQPEQVCSMVHCVAGRTQWIWWMAPYKFDSEMNTYTTANYSINIMSVAKSWNWIWRNAHIHYVCLPPPCLRRFGQATRDPLRWSSGA